MKKNSNLSSLAVKANTLLAKNQLLPAMDIYKKICEIDSSNQSAWITLGSIAGRMGKYTEAETAFKNATRLEKNNLNTALLLSRSQEALGKIKEALETLIPHQNQCDKIPDILLKIAILHGQNGNYHESIKYATKYVALNDANPTAYQCLASDYEAINDFDNASLNYERALKISPDSFNIHNSYGAMLHRYGLWGQALQEYNASLQYKNDNPLVHYNIASIYHTLGHYQDAVEHYNLAINLKDNFTEAIIGLGKSHRSLSNIEESIKLYDKVISIMPNNYEALANKGLAYASNAEFDKAIEHLLEALTLNPGNIEIICELSSVYERKGEISKAEELLSPLLKSHSHHHKFTTAYGAISRSINKQTTAIQLLKTSATDSTLPPPTRAEIHFLLGKLFNDEKDYDAAFAHYRQANNLQPDIYVSDEAKTAVEKRKSVYSRTQLSKIPAASHKDITPIFIIGMPRSGTTLIEQIISSHSNVYGAGELSYLNKVSFELQESIHSNILDEIIPNKINQAYIDSISDEYLKLASRSVQKERYITDKMPHNFQLLGIIQTLFPNAKVIHSIRNPIDNCLSIYFSNLNALHPYAGRLENIAEYYTEFYMNLMAHWREVLDIEILDIEYETLVSDQASISKRIIQYCGLDWEENCLEYYKTKRNVATISYDQVRKPIYKTSVGRWHNYSKHIAPLLKHFE